MVFEKKPVTEKRLPFCTTLDPEAYQRLKDHSEKQAKPMSDILTAMIMKHIPGDAFWEVGFKLGRGRGKE